MKPPEQELERRRPVWDALSQLFLDTELEDDNHREIAALIIASGYSPAEIQAILWDEVYPVAVWNMLSVAGEWSGFDLDQMQAEILSRRHRRTIWTRLYGLLPFSPVRIIRKEWEELLPFLETQFARESRES